MRFLQCSKSVSLLKGLHLTPPKCFYSSGALDLAYNDYKCEKTCNKTPPFVILHGLFGAKENWNSLCKAYQQKTAPQRRIFALDARNHGASPHSNDHNYEFLAEDVKHFLDKHNLGKVAIMGHSMGGRGVMLFALKYPELVEKLIVVDISPIKTSPSLGTMPEMFGILEKVKMPKNVTLAQARQNIHEQLDKYFDKALRSFLITNLVPDKDSFKWRINIDALKTNFKNIATPPDPQNRKYTGPVLFIAGAASDFLHKEDEPEILKIFPNSSFEYISNAGHWVHAENPNKFLELSLNFLNS